MFNLEAYVLKANILSIRKCVFVPDDTMYVNGMYNLYAYVITADDMAMACLTLRICVPS